MKDKDYQKETKDALKKLEAKLLTDWENLHKIDDELVWHYTDQNGLISILQYGTIRLSNAFYLNDSLEVKHAKNLIYHFVSEKLNTTTGSPETSEFFELIATSMDISDLISQPLVSCFSGEKGKDLLSQWQSYGSSGLGYALGFEPNKLTLTDPNTKLRKIIYNEEEQKKILNDSIDLYVAELESILSKSTASTAYKNEFIRDFSHSLSKILHEYLYCFKHPSWEAEHEVRVVYPITPFLTAKKIPNPSDINFRSSQTGQIIPYKDLVIKKADPTDFIERLPLKTIVVGPKIDFYMAKNSLEQLLEKYEYTSAFKVTIEQSKLTLK